MGYIDLAATEARGMFSPPNGNEPQVLPDYWREVIGGPIRTDLPDLTDAELNALGWKGPIVMPTNLGYFTHDYKWNKETREYDVTEISEYDKQRRVQYQQFWDKLLNTTAYTTIKTAATQSLQANTIATEFIALMSDAKAGRANVEKIQEALTEIVSGIAFNAEELGHVAHGEITSKRNWVL